jgi:HAD superfamily hydrolase (TIGR01549 family)
MTNTTEGIPGNISSFRLFIFDLDGTLYDQPGLRRKLLMNLLIKLIFLRIRPSDLRIITAFRKQREKHKGYASSNLRDEQYMWCAEELNIEAPRIKRIIEKRMFIEPLRFLPRMKYQGIDELFNALRNNGKLIAVFSDFPVEEKLRVLGLKADSYFCSTDENINQLKPSAKALILICACMNCPVNEAVYIGDRNDTDGESARQAGMNYIIIDRSDAKRGNYYRNLLNLIQEPL